MHAPKKYLKFLNFLKLGYSYTILYFKHNSVKTAKDFATFNDYDI